MTLSQESVLRWANGLWGIAITGPKNDADREYLAEYYAMDPSDQEMISWVYGPPPLPGSADGRD